MTGSDFGAGIGQAIEGLFFAVVLLPILAAVICCAGGWYLGDRYDLPEITIHTRGTK